MNQITIKEIYDFVYYLEKRSKETQNQILGKELDDAMHLGSSSLEILGAIRKILINRNNEVKSILASDEFETVEKIIKYINKSYG